MLLLRRWSHVGRRPIPIESNVNIDLLVPPTRLRPAFGKTGVGNIIRVTGPLGSMGLPLHHGLKLTVGPGLVQDERLLRIEVDQESFDRMSKYSQKFVRAMWGTTTSLLRRHVEGVTEVLLYALLFINLGIPGSSPSSWGWI